jgi:hypothetical protein
MVIKMSDNLILKSLHYNDYVPFMSMYYLKLSEKGFITWRIAACRGTGFEDPNLPLQFRVNELNLKLPANFDLRMRVGNRYFFM